MTCVKRKEMSRGDLVDYVMLSVARTPTLGYQVKHHKAHSRSQSLPFFFFFFLVASLTK